MEKTTKGMSRRSFIGMGAVAAMAAGAAGLAGCAPAGGDSTAKTEDGGHIESAGSSAPSDVHILSLIHIFPTGGTAHDPQVLRLRLIR